MRGLSVSHILCQMTSTVYPGQIRHRQLFAGGIMPAFARHHLGAVPAAGQYSAYLIERSHPAAEISLAEQSPVDTAWCSRTRLSASSRGLSPAPRR